MIGLVDYDFCTSNITTRLIPNIEIMKLATYYKTEENQFCRLLALNEQELRAYDKIYFFSEANTIPQVPEHFLRASQVIYGGTAFTKGKYIPFENDIIDYTIPKPFIYKDFLKQKYNNGVKANVISHVLDDTYYRNYAGENELPLPAILPRKRVILYDKDFFYPDWQETIKKISNRNPSSIIRIHPVECKTLTDYFTLRSYQKFARANDIILNLDIPLNEVAYMLKHYKKLFLADITAFSNIYIPFGGNLKTNFLYFKDLIYKLNLLYSFWSCGIIIKMRYQEPNTGFNNPIHNLSKSIDNWSEISSASKRKKTINERITRKKKTIEEEERDLFLKFNSFAKDLFDQSFNDIKTRGYWRV